MTDPDRRPLLPEVLHDALVVPGGLWQRIDVRAETGSTNADAVEAARAGEPEGLVVVAERQTAGRGRRDRQWVSPPGAGLTLSVLLRPGVPQNAWSWLPLMAGVALCEAVGASASLKWPNDLLIGDAKCAGILAEAAGDAVVIGIGLNVTTRTDELPPTTAAATKTAAGPVATKTAAATQAAAGLSATSLLLADAPTTDREALLRSLLGCLSRWYADWRAEDGNAEACGLADAYRKRCATIGRRVTVHLPDGDTLTGDATTVDGDGQLVIRTDDGDRRVSAGDVIHVR